MEMQENVLPDQFVKPFAKVRYLLDKSGVHFLDCKKISPFIKYWKFMYIVPISFTLIMSLTTYFVKAVSKMDDLIDIANSMSVMFVVVQALIKAGTVVYYNEDISYIIRELAKLWPKDEDLSEIQIVAKAKNLRRLNICIDVYFWINIIGSWQYIMVPMIEVFIRMFILSQDAELRFPFGCLFPFDPTESWFRYLTVYFFEYFGIIHLIYLLLGTELLMITVTSHLSTLFNLLSSEVLTLQPVSNDPLPYSLEIEGENGVSHSAGKKNLISYIVKKHQILIMLSKMTDNTFNKVIFTNITASTISICFFGFVAKTAKQASDIANNIVGVIASILPIFNLCYYGQMLTDSSESLASSVYNSMWYEGGTRYQKILCLIMFRSQNSCYISSLKYAPVTLSMFSTVMSTTWSYFSLMMSVYEEN